MMSRIRNTAGILDLSLVNYKKSGTRFRNHLRIMPVTKTIKSESGGDGKSKSSVVVVALLGVLRDRDAEVFNDAKASAAARESLDRMVRQLSLDDNGLGCVVISAAKSPLPIVITQTASPFLIQYVNAAWTALCGYTYEEAVGNTLKMIQGRGDGVGQDCAAGMSHDAMKKNTYELEGLRVGVALLQSGEWVECPEQLQKPPQRARYIP